MKARVLGPTSQSSRLRLASVAVAFHRLPHPRRLASSLRTKQASKRRVSASNRYPQSRPPPLRLLHPACQTTVCQHLLQRLLRSFTCLPIPLLQSCIHARRTTYVPTRTSPSRAASQAVCAAIIRARRPLQKARTYRPRRSCVIRRRTRVSEAS